MKSTRQQSIRIARTETGERDGSFFFLVRLQISRLTEIYFQVRFLFKLLAQFVFTVCSDGPNATTATTIDDDLSNQHGLTYLLRSADQTAVTIHFQHP